jgi:hypothetical protein
LDFSKGDVIVDEPGYYVLDRDSVLPDYGLFEVSANDVTIDFRGYTLEGEGGFDNHLYITADRVTLKNGTVSGDFDVVGIGGDILVTDMRLDFSAYFQLGGCRVQNSVLISEIELNGCVLQANRIERPIELVDAASQVMDNQINAPIYSFGGADDSVIARNTMMGDDPNTGINITGNNFQVIDNLIQVNETGDRAIVIDGTGNMLRGNIVRSSSDPSVGKWNYGIVFLQDGNYYGDNLISAEVPFELGGTIQVDLGGNQGL